MKHRPYRHVHDCRQIEVGGEVAQDRCALVSLGKNQACLHLDLGLLSFQKAMVSAGEATQLLYSAAAVLAS